LFVVPRQPREFFQGKDDDGFLALLCHYLRSALPGSPEYFAKLRLRGLYCQALAGGTCCFLSGSCFFEILALIYYSD
jgi:hypothetical protein